MRKFLRITALTSGIICAVSLVVLAYTYFESFAGRYNRFRTKFSKNKKK